MSIVNQKGQLYKLVANNDRGYASFELVEDVPVFQFSSQIDCQIAITEQGRLYHLNDPIYLDTEVSNFKIVKDYDDGFFALTEDGDFYSIKLQDGDLALTLVDRDIKFFTVTVDYKDVISVNGDNQWCSYNAGRVIIPPGDRQNLPDLDHLPDVKDIVRADVGCMITHSHIYIFGYRYRNGIPITANKIELEGSYLSSGIFIDCNDDDEPLTLMAVEVEEDGRLLTSLNPGNKCNVWNQLIEDMHQSSPWIGFIRYYGCWALYNKDGYSYYIKEDFSLTSTEIPPHILANASRLKNSMTKI